MPKIFSDFLRLCGCLKRFFSPCPILCMGGWEHSCLSLSHSLSITVSLSVKWKTVGNTDHSQKHSTRANPVHSRLECHQCAYIYSIWHKVLGVFFIICFLIEGIVQVKLVNEGYMEDLKHKCEAYHFINALTFIFLLKPVLFEL